MKAHLFNWKYPGLSDQKSSQNPSKDARVDPFSTKFSPRFAQNILIGKNCDRVTARECCYNTVPHASLHVSPIQSAAGQDSQLLRPIRPSHRTLYNNDISHNTLHPSTPTSSPRSTTWKNHFLSQLREVILEANICNL